MGDKKTVELFADIKFKGLENLKKISADRHFKVKSICTAKTEVRVEILEA